MGAFELLGGVVVDKVRVADDPPLSGSEVADCGFGFGLSVSDSCSSLLFGVFDATSVVLLSLLCAEPSVGDARSSAAPDVGVFGCVELDAVADADVEG